MILMVLMQNIKTIIGAMAGILIGVLLMWIWASTVLIPQAKDEVHAEYRVAAERAKSEASMQTNEVERKMRNALPEEIRCLLAGTPCPDSLHPR